MACKRCARLKPFGIWQKPNVQGGVNGEQGSVNGVQGKNHLVFGKNQKCRGVQMVNKGL